MLIEASMAALSEKILDSPEPIDIRLWTRSGKIQSWHRCISLKYGRTRQTLWSAVQMLTQKLCCQTIHDCPKVVPLHYESE